MQSLALLQKDLKNNDLAPIYLWHGEDRYSLREGVRLIKGSYITEDPSGSGIEILAGKDVSAEEIVYAANTSSFFASRLVIADEIPFFSSETTGSDSQDLERLLMYCEEPNPNTCLILIADKINKKRKLYKAILKNGKVYEFSYPKRYQEWQTWVEEGVKARGKMIRPSEAGFLIEWSGHYTGVLDREIDKLVSYLGEREEITRADISNICIPMAETTVFAMLDAIASGASEKALQKLAEVLTREHYLKVHTMIVRQIRLLLAGTIIRARGGTVEELMEKTGIRSPFEGNKIFRQAGRFSPAKLERTLQDCLETEIALKSGIRNPQLLLEMMVIRFCKH